MNALEAIRLSLRGLAVNKLRSALTMLGIIIGVAAVIALLAVGQGVDRLVRDQLQSVGTNLLFVVPGSLNDVRQSGAAARPSLTLADAEAIVQPGNVPYAARVAPELLSNATVSYRRLNLRVSVSGVTPIYEATRNRPIQLGSFVTESDMNSQARVAVLGSRIADRMFGANYPLGQTVRINNIPFKVAGVLQSKGGAGGFGGGNQDDVVLVPLSTALERLFPSSRTQRGEPRVSVIYVQVVREDLMRPAMDQISELLRRRHDIKFQGEDDFTVINQADLLQIFGQITGVLTLFLGAIAGISLLVGGIGIMNIMLVSVTERTREIGLRKAVGAKRRDILGQFLIESITLALVGGALGIALGIGGAVALSSLAEDLSPVVTVQSVLLATGASTAIGLFFGIYPATRAASLNPIEALRYE